jgi:hypothetical protein
MRRNQAIYKLVRVHLKAEDANWNAQQAIVHCNVQREGAFPAFGGSGNRGQLVEGRAGVGVQFVQWLAV